MLRLRFVITFLVMSSVLQANAGPGQPPAKDLHGDPLPPSALARLGTVRWVHKYAHFAAFLPDGKTVVTAGSDATIRIWEFPSGKEQSRISLRNEPDSSFGPYGSSAAVALAKNGKTIATNIGPGEISLHDLGTGKELPGLKWEVQAAKGGRVSGGTPRLAFSPNDKHLAVFESDGTMRIWDWAAAKQIHPPFKLSANGGPLAYATDGKSIATLDYGESDAVRLWNAETGGLLWRFKPKNRDYLSEFAFAPDGKSLAVCGDEDIYLVDAATGKEIRKLAVGEPESLIFSNDGSKLYATSWLPNGERLLELDVATGKVLRECAAEYGTLALAPDGSTLVMASRGNGPTFFNLAAGKDMARLFAPSSALRTVQFSLDGKTLLTTRQGMPSIQNWNAGTGQDLGQVAFPLTLTLLAAGPDGKLLAGNDRNNAGGFAANPSKDVTIVDASSGKEVGTISLQSGEYNLSVCFSPDGKTLALRQPMEGKIELYDLAGPKLRHTLPIAKAPITSKGKFGPASASAGQYGAIVFSPDGSMVAALADANIMGLWDAATGKRMGSLTPPAGRGGFEGAAAFSPNGRCLALEMRDGTAVLYELSTAQLRHSFGKPPAAKFAVQFGGPSYYYNQGVTGPRFAFAPDGKTIAQAGSDGLVYLWHVLQEREAVIFKGHSDAVASVAFAAHGKVLASASADGTALIWDAARAGRPVPAAQAPKMGEMESWWKSLAGLDAAEAFAAIRGFAAAPDQAVAWMKDHVKAVPALEEKRTHDLIAQLGDKEFKVRFRAASELLRMGEQIIPALDKALQAHPELTSILEDVRSKATPELLLQGERLRDFRAVEVLEFIGTPQARQVLQTLAAGAPGALLTVSANAALRR